VLLIGLTGGIASGKTLVSDAFAAFGVPVIDADLLARDVVAPGSKGLKQLLDHFGTSILNADQSLNRAALREIIFTNPEHRKTVDNTLHPLIRERSDQQISKASKQGHAYAVYAIPLLVETGQTERFDRIIVVDVPTEVQISRLVQRDNSSREEAQAILSAQASRDERLSVADEIIDNTGTKEQTLNRVRELHKAFRKAFNEADS